MRFNIRPVLWSFGMVFGLALLPATVMADADDSPTATNSTSATEPHDGLFDWLDQRSVYYGDFFPEPLLVDDTSQENDGELEFNCLHTQTGAEHTDIAAVEVQKSFGLFTFELGVPYERDASAGDISQGIGNIDLGVRCPIYQSVSAKGFFDDTIGVGLEAGIPASSAISINPELDPEVFNDLKLGDHFSLQTVLDYSVLLGGGDNGGQQTFEYGFAFAYALPYAELPLPGVNQFTPLFELSGETGLNEDEAGQNSLLGSAGFRADLKPILGLQPSLGIGFVFPIDSGAHAEVHWGIATSLIFEF